MSSDPFDQAAVFDEFEVDLAQAESNVPPPGVYVAKCMSVSKDMSKAGNPMFIWDFRIIGDDHGKKCPASGMSPKTVYTAVTPKALWKLEEVLVGLQVCKPGEAVKFTKADVVDRLCLIAVEHSEYNGRPQAEISAFKPYTGGLDKNISGDDVPF